MKKFFMLMMAMAAIICLSSSCGDGKTPINNPTATVTEIQQITPTPTTPPTKPPTTPPTPITSGLIPQQINKLGEESTVFITGRGQPGSGVIIYKQNNTNTYYVLTAAHVVGTEPGEEEVPYKLLTPDGKEHIVAKYNDYQNKVQKFRESTDLAVIEFTAEPNREYQVAPLAKSIFQGMPVYAFGWTSCLGGNQRQFQKTEGQICKINPDSKNGWNVSYTNNIIEGVSGGPVFDSNGHVVAIQAGQGGNIGPISDNGCNSLPIKPNPKFNYGLGVPIRENFEILQSKLPQRLEIETQSNTSSQKEFVANVECRQKSPVTQCPPILSPGERCDFDR
ncbi:S1 family peptidase [Nostoc linckia]|nr:serine protease [Nostoc linckia]